MEKGGRKIGCLFMSLKGGDNMAIVADYIQKNDLDTYKKMERICGRNKKIQLGDKTKNLMKHDAYKRQGRRIKQVKWS